MKNLLQILFLVGIIALWGQAKAYDVIIDIDVTHTSKGAQTSVDGSAYTLINDQKTNIELSSLKIQAPDDRSISGEEWALEWLGENAEDLILSTGLDPNLVEVELDLKKHKVKCRGRQNPECRAQLAVRLTVTRL